MLEKTFCSSPWFHIRIDPLGNFVPCRWTSDVYNIPEWNVRNSSVLDFVNSSVMKEIRTNMLQGIPNSLCSACEYEEQNGKVSGRQRQLLKSAIDIKNFDKSFCASPHFERFKFSYENHGATDFTPVDLQIDLGNTCNSACIMCNPRCSSRLATDYEKLHSIDPRLFIKPSKPTNWADDPELLDKFVNELSSLPNIKYIHFLGGETLHLRSFYNICQKLINLGLAKNISIGTTTNCTIYTEELEHIVREFKHVHLGLSIESFDPINDYIRYPSRISDIKQNILKFINLSKQVDLHLSLRITPTALSAYHLDTIFDFILENNITAESCNILHEPACLRIEILPDYIIDQILKKIDNVIQRHGLVEHDSKIINRRRQDLVQQVNSEVIFEYKRFFTNCLPPYDAEKQRHDLVKFIQSFESLRNNTVLSYLPEYEEFLRSYGYKA